MVVGKSDLKDMMEKHDLRPSKSLGQNFVVDPNTILKIIRAANIEKGCLLYTSDAADD